MRLFKPICLHNDPLSEMTSWGSSTAFISWNYRRRNYHGYCTRSHLLCLKTSVFSVCVWLYCVTVVAVLLVEGLPGFSQYPSSAVSVSEITYVQTTELHHPLSSCLSILLYLSVTHSSTHSLSLFLLCVLIGLFVHAE